MRLLFIYFYKDKGPFKKGTTIRFSKKYNIDNIKVSDKVSDDDLQFNFSLSKNLSFQDDFYSKNTDLGVLIGENGTGKSILINSLRDEKNDYSFCIYEENKEFIILENDLFKLREYKEYDKYTIPYEYESNVTVKINNTKIKYHRTFKSIYYSSILEIVNKNLNDDFNISNIYLLNKINEPDLNKKIEQLEINDLQMMNNFRYETKHDISPTFFDDAKNFIKDSYIQLFEKTMELLQESKDDKKINEIFNKLPEFILDNIYRYHLKGNELFIKEIENSQSLINKYTDLFKKGKFINILFLDKENTTFQIKKGNEEIIDNKGKTINVIKTIIEDDYSFFFEVVKNHLKSLDDELLKLIFIKKMELKYMNNNNNKRLYIYLTKLLKSNYIEDYEKDFFNKQFNEKKDFEFKLAVLCRKKLKGDNPLFENNKIDLHTYNEFVKDAIHPFSFTFDPPISSGQRAKELISARINDAIQKINKEESNQNILILLDEADLKLHLEWQRKFIHDLIEFLNTHSDNKFYILYATHSPMILSDITDDRVVFLQKEKIIIKDKNNRDIEKEFSKDVSENKDKKRTFGANIYDLYHDSFFMDQFMGEFAQNKINEIIDIINLYKIIEKFEKNRKLKEYKTLKSFINKYDLFKIINSYYLRYTEKSKIEQKYWKIELFKILKRAYKEKHFIEKIKSHIANDKTILQNTIESIGEPILRNQLLDDIKNIGVINNIDEIFHQLKNLSPDEIEQELLKYDREKQIEIWKKLFQSKDIK